MSKSFALAFCRLTLLLLCTLPLTSQAASSKEAPLDLSILRQRDALRPYMTSQQRSAYVEAAQRIKQGESDIRSGQNLQLQKPSALNPNKDLKPIHERGERLVEAGEAKIAAGQKQIVELLTVVQTKQAANQAIATKKYNFNLVEQGYATALEEAATQTLETCLNAGYKNVFFDGLRIITAEQNMKAGPKVHNAVYDTFIKADGTQFSVTVPLGLKLAKGETSAEYTFQYDNASVFEGEKVALLAIELTAPGSGGDALLSVRALDLSSQQLISSVLFYIPDASEVLESVSSTSSDDATSTDEGATMTSKAPRTIPESVTINEQNQLIDKLASLATPYSFETVTIAETSAQSVLLDGLLKDTLLKNSKLILTESDFVQRAYLPTGVAPEALSNTATATLTVTPSAGGYTMVAKAHGSDRALEVGTVTLNLPE